jgi:signal transduction histidine kinase
VETERLVVLIAAGEASAVAPARPVLEGAGYGVARVPDGPAALAAVEAGDVDLLLLDLPLSDAAWTELVAALRTAAGERYLPTLLVLPASGPAARRRAGALGADDAIPVPWEADDLLACVAGWARVRRRLRALEVRVAEQAEQARRVQELETVGQVAAAMMHDFRGLLGVITAFNELVLARWGATDPPRRYLEEITKAGEQATALTRQLLAFSRRQTLAPRVLDLNTVIRELDLMLQAVLTEATELDRRLTPTPAWVRGDPGQLTQVLLNLAVNARDAMPRGGHFQIETAIVDLDAAFAQAHPPLVPGQYVRLRVRDSGCGMDAATLARIFEPFFTTKPPGKGTGLGLATVYGIVKESGGYIWADSTPGVGTTFTIYLPYVVGGPDAREAPR